MKVNTVYLSVNEFKKLVAEAENCKEECRTLDAKVIETNLKYAKLCKFAVRKCISEWRLLSKQLDDLLEFDSHSSAITQEDLRELISLGIPEEYIKLEIRKMKEEEDDNK